MKIVVLFPDTIPGESENQLLNDKNALGLESFLEGTDHELIILQNNKDDLEEASKNNIDVVEVTDSNTVSVAERLEPFNVEIQHYDPINQKDNRNSRFVNTDELLATSDVITIHSPSTP